MTTRVEVSGLAELRSALKAIDSKLPRELTKAHRKVALAVVDDAQEEMAGLSTPKADEAAQGIRPRASQKGAAVALLGANPFIRSTEFGTLMHHVFGREMPVAMMKRPVFGSPTTEGYAFYPTLRTFLASPRFEDTYYDALDQVYAAAFPKGHL